MCISPMRFNVVVLYQIASGRLHGCPVGAAIFFHVVALSLLASIARAFLADGRAFSGYVAVTKS